MRHTIPPSDITGLILAGGRGSRMHDSDKGLQTLKGRALVQHVMDRLRPQVGSLCISANRNLDQYLAFGVPVFGDDFPDYAGPLAGIHAALAYCTTPWLACVPCDCPGLPTDLVARLALAVNETGAGLTFASTGSGATHRTHPVCCLLHATLREHLRAYLEGGGRKVGGWHAMLKSADMHFADGGAFRNINSLAELREYEEAMP